jgi:hypothetical protein
MTPIEALEVVGLRPGKRYTATQLDQAVRQAESLALVRIRHARTSKDQDQAMQELPVIKEAEKVLQGCLVGGVLCVKPQKAKAGVSRSKVPGHRTTATRRQVAPVATRPSGARSAKGFIQVQPMLLQAFKAARDLLFFSWWALTLPVRFLSQRRLVASAVSFLLVSGTLWCSWTFLSGGAIGVSQTAESLSGWLDYTLVGLVTGQRKAAERHSSLDQTHLILDLEEGAQLRLDGRMVPEGSRSLVVSNGKHSIELTQNSGQSLCVGTLCFPAGGSLQVVSHGTPSGQPEAALQVQAPPPYNKE